MSDRLVTLALDAASALEGMPALVRRYAEAAGKDAEEAARERRLALDRLLVAERERLDAARVDARGAVERAESRIATARSMTHDASVRLGEAESDVAFAEARVAKAEAVRRRHARPTGRALATFAAERLRQLDEIAAAWGRARPRRDRDLIDELRSRFRALTDGPTSRGATR